MLKFNLQIFIITLLLSAIPFLNSACTKSSAQLSNTNASQSSSPEKQVQAEDVESSKEPTIYLKPEAKGLKIAWQNLTASGQYRLAKFSDMTFNEAAKRSLAENFGADRKPLPYTYLWGYLGYKKRAMEDHLAAIVVDTTKSDVNRFGLVIFSPPQNKPNFYETNWLYRDRDLSKATVNLLSGSFSVGEYLDDGSRKGCLVNWKKELKKFECD